MAKRKVVAKANKQAGSKKKQGRKWNPAQDRQGIEVWLDKVKTLI